MVVEEDLGHLADDVAAREWVAADVGGVGRTERGDLRRE